ncbi:hypothetical protein MIND_00004500 [Mycena indigotica]|uniref:Uncharacterized protein n=1 Tax=Mycena indigotica TaxID=2126181 RepID=A0A8H6TDY0_9AGAR|nr:uncharacterized protein MIND_00004500 [Mycena indigotica]KAF7314907.1 hypothetical protein MIND_00004500 [Mycena indigotica]
MDDIVKIFNFLRQDGTVDIELQLGDEVRNINASFLPTLWLTAVAVDRAAVDHTEKMDDIEELFEFLRLGGTVDIGLQLASGNDVDRAVVNRAAVDRTAVKKKMKKIRRFYARVPPTDERRQEIQRQGLLNVNKVVDAGIMHCNKEGFPVSVKNIILSFSKRVADVERPEIRTRGSTETLDGPADDDYKYQFKKLPPEEESDDDGNDNGSEDTESEGNGKGKDNSNSTSAGPNDEGKGKSKGKGKGLGQ